MDIPFYKELLGRESTSGKEGALASWLANVLKTDANSVEVMEVGDGTSNLLISWGEPDIVFCTHMDTVPPFIAPSEESVILPDGTPDTVFRGRGTCDAKGQLFAMWTACKRLEEAGERGFALLLLAGEETGSFGAKAFSRDHEGGRVVIVGEPTDNCLVSASKGTKSFALTFRGEPFHSGYPEHGKSAIDAFVDFVNALREASIPDDDILGPTTWNIGKLFSDNPQNIMSPELSCRLYFRTTFASDAMVQNLIPELASRFGGIEVECFGGDTPMRYLTPEGFPVKTVAFGSDAPQLKKFREKIICGAGSILVAHRPDEQVLLSELSTASDNYVRLFKKLKTR